MKKIVSSIALLITLYTTAVAQNVGIGTTDPQNKLQVQGSLLVTAPTVATSTLPTAGQIKSMANASTITFANTDSTGRIYDPGGAAGNYAPSQTANTSIASAVNAIGIEVTVESIDLSSADSLIIKESISGATLLAVGNLYTTTGIWTFNSSTLYIIFKSNGDANVGAGFSLLFRKLYSNINSLPNLSGFNGNAFFFDTKTGALRSGSLNNSIRGLYSVALGNNNTASGNNSLAIGLSNNALGLYATSIGYSNNADGIASVATGQNTSASGAYTTSMGQNTIASGNVATAIGYSTTASGSVATAMGDNTNAIGTRSTAMGQNTTANGSYTTAMGSNTFANGNYSTAIGNNTSANGHYSIAMGSNTIAGGAYATTTGKYTNATGYAATAIGDSSLASGKFSFASGFRTIASGNFSTAFGESADASGLNSTAMGKGTTASASLSTALGNNTTATGITATAMGSGTEASGDGATAMGVGTTASGNNSTSMGLNTTASGNNSTAMGVGATASGSNSIAMGTSVSTNNATGSFIIGDNSTADILNIVTSNSFRARFNGGYRFFTSAAAINAESCQLPAGGNAWVTASDFKLKEKITIADGEDFLKKISLMKLGSWNYISQNPLKQRHYGPMAQDFYAAFGKDEFGTVGNDTTINSADFDGVNLIAIQALEKRTQKIEQLEKENQELKKMMLQLRKEMDTMMNK